MDIAHAIEQLVPGAEYSGSVTPDYADKIGGHRTAFEKIKWEDKRPKPSWAEIAAVPLPKAEPRQDLESRLAALEERIKILEQKQ